MRYSWSASRLLVKEIQSPFGDHPGKLSRCPSGFVRFTHSPVASVWITSRPSCSYTSFSPSGDHEGNPLLLPSGVTFLSAVPSLFITSTCAVGWVAPGKYMPSEKAIRLPSGDHAGARARPSFLSNRILRPLPSCFINAIVVELIDTAMSSPFGELAGKTKLASASNRNSG